MKPIQLITSLSVCALLIACGGPTPEAPTDVAAVKEPQAAPAETTAIGNEPPQAASFEPAEGEGNAASVCPDDGPVLPGSGVCVGRAVNFMSELIEPAPPPENCRWQANETAMPGGHLLYLALACDGEVPGLEYGGGARSAEFTYDGATLIRVISADPGQAPAAIDAFARPGIEDAEMGADCAARQIEGEGITGDSWVFEVPEEQIDYSEPWFSPCGPFGPGDSGNFWRVFDGFAWFFPQSQDAWQLIHPSSVVLVDSE